MKANKHLTVHGELKDRGRIKWTAMMLTEHVQMLKDWQEEQYTTPRPELEEMDFDAISDEIRFAFRNSSLIQLKVWRNGVTSTLSGTIQHFSSEQQCLTLDDGRQQHSSIPFSEIIAATSIG